MPGEPSSELKFEIGHVLFIDIVGYSKLLINEQSEQLETLKKIVRGTEQFRLAEAEGKLLRLPTGDGGALVFRTNPEAPVLCTLEIGKELKKHPELHVRMGIHSGPVNQITDLNEQANIAGAGINIAQRVMDCADAGHILLSKHVADDLEQYPRWRPYLHELGECEVKHGVRIGVVNLYGDEIGNPQVPKQLKVLRKHRARTRWAAIAAALLLLIGVVTAFVIVSKKSAQSISTIPEKSIAVLPFESLSEEKANAYFTDGIPEEILTRLAKIADLKVISRTSTQQFQSKPANLSEIAKQLGVANILEGSVQRSADQVRVNVQLVKAATDAHLWADTFDRKLTDIFTVESEIAKAVADTLQAKLSGKEQSTIAARPTENSEAHDLYLKGRYFFGKRTADDFKRAIDYFHQAIAKDPNYALAYAGLADSYVLLPGYSNESSSAELFSKARAAAEKALAIDKNLAEAHVSLGLVLNDADLNLKAAKREYGRALELNPNYAAAHYFLGISVLAPLGQVDQAIVELKRAVELDPLRGDKRFEELVAKVFSTQNSSTPSP
jgi:adenylate cyclase